MAKSIVLISEDSFLCFAEKMIENTDVKIQHYSSVEDFFKTVAKLYTKKSSFSLRAKEDARDYYEIECDASAFWIVENPNDLDKSIKKTINIIRWMRLKQPIIVSSFLQQSYFENNQHLGEKFFTNYPESDRFTRLPLLPQEIATIFASSFSLQNNSNNLPNEANQDLDHDLPYFPYSIPGKNNPQKYN